MDVLGFFYDKTNSFLCPEFSIIPCYRQIKGQKILANTIATQ